MSLMEPRPRHAIRILGCRVDSTAMQGALDWCLAACRSRGPARILLTANASHLVQVQDDPALRQACDAADFVTADGMSLVWASRLLGTPLPERVAGIDLLQRLLDVAQDHKFRIFLLGAKQEVLASLVKRLRDEHPELELAGWRDGYFGPGEHESVLRQIAGSNAHILFVGMPSPFKDVWCQRYRDQLGVRLIIGVGGAFDVLAGMVPRAPYWMQQSGLEWAWRLLLEPRRLWRRYLYGNSRFIWLVLKQRLLRAPA
jgi:N-acetylglucosaminyldiphosphoundecaprenol N-acetyl-beta-D-mannosaminyltransferase